jgi:hypothetical protein
VAFAGWRPAADDARNEILVCDPGDNVLEGRAKHGWEAIPRQIPLRFGNRRPNVVLLPAGTFTITGAVLVRPAGSSSAASLGKAVTATGMPDLSQNMNPAWEGLCGPTSASNLLFFMAQRQAGILPAFPRGPSVAADDGVIRLVTGGLTEILPASLAGRMGVSQAGAGATNIGIRDGLESWLRDHDAERWTVELDWFDDAEKTPAQQKEFFGRLAQAVADDGGAVLCLWPGTEFTDAAIDESAAPENAGNVAAGDDSSRSPAETPQEASRGAPAGTAADAEFPSPPTTAAAPPALPGRAGTGPSPRQAVEQARVRVREARTHLARNEPKQAFDSAAQAVSVLQRHGADTKEAAEVLADALAVCQELEGRLPRSRRGPSDKRTLFQ